MTSDKKDSTDEAKLTAKEENLAETAGISSMRVLKEHEKIAFYAVTVFD